MILCKKFLLSVVSVAHNITLNKISHLRFYLTQCFYSPYPTVSFNFWVDLHFHPFLPLSPSKSMIILPFFYFCVLKEVKSRIEFFFHKIKIVSTPQNFYIAVSAFIIQFLCFNFKFLGPPIVMMIKFWWFLKSWFLAFLILERTRSIYIIIFTLIINNFLAE